MATERADTSTRELNELSNRLYSDHRQTYSTWRTRIEWAWRKLEMKENILAWETNYERLHGKAAVDESGADVFASPNEIGLATQELIDTVFPSTPLPSLMAETPVAEEVLPIMEQMCFNELRKVANKRILRALVRDAVCAKRGVLKVTYQPQYLQSGQGEEDERQMAAEAMKVQMENQQAGMGMPPQITPEDMHWLHMARHRLELTRYDPSSPAYWLLSVHLVDHSLLHKPVQGGRIQFTRVAGQDFLYDPDAKTFEEATWTAERIWEHVDDLKNDPLLKNLEGVKCGTTKTSTLSNSDGELDATDQNTVDADSSTGEKPSYVMLWRIHDKRNNVYIVLAWDHRDKLPLHIGPWPYPSDTPVYLVLDLDQTEEVKKPITIMEKAWDFQLELDEVWGKIRTLIKKYMPRILIEDGAFEAADQAEWDDTQNPFIHCGPGTAQRIQTLNLVPELKPLFERAAVLEAKIKRIVGIWEIAQGVPQANTATEAQIMANQQDVRSSPKREAVNDFLSEVCLTVLKLHRRFTTTEMTVQMRGGTEGLNWRLIRPEQIPEALHVEIDEWSWGAANPDLAKRQWTEVLPILQNNPRVDQDKIVLETLRRHDIRNPEKFLLPPAPPMPAIPSGSAATDASLPPGVGQMAGDAAGLQNRGTPENMTMPMMPAA